MTPLDTTLVKLAQTLSDNKIPYMVIGGMANAVWGEPRATLDIDVTIWVDEDATANVVSILSGLFRSLITDHISFVRETNVLPLESEDGVRVDLIFGKLPYEQEAIARAVEVAIENVPVRVCTPEDLILHKIISDRERDINDARGVTIRRMSSLDISYLEPRIRELSDALDRPEIWNLWATWKKNAE